MFYRESVLCQERCNPSILRTTNVVQRKTLTTATSNARFYIDDPPRLVLPRSSLSGSGTRSRPWRDAARSEHRIDPPSASLMRFMRVVIPRQFGWAAPATVLAAPRPQPLSSLAVSSSSSNTNPCTYRKSPPPKLPSPCGHGIPRLFSKTLQNHLQTGHQG
jgi:hypothetical protein